MKKQKKLTRLLFVLLLSSMLLPGISIAKIYQQNADNFIILLDTSGSMDDELLVKGKTKLSAAKDALKQLNNDIPELEYKAGLYQLVPFKAISPVGIYNKQSLAASIESLPESPPDIGFVPVSTPLGMGLEKLGTVLSGLSGKTVIYLISDGDNTDSLDPVEEAAKLLRDHDVCFSIISTCTARSQEGVSILNDIASLNDCSSATHTTRMYYEVKLATNALYMVKEEPQMAKVEPVIGEPEAYSPPDSDNDGISNDMDKCQRTPTGYVVDEAGCRIQEPVSLSKISFGAGMSNILAGKDNELNKIGEYLSNHPEAVALISGHTDNIGSEESNLKLSKKRADFVYDYLTSNWDINKEQVTVKWYGETKPVASNTTAVGRKENRSAQINISGAYQKK